MVDEVLADGVVTVHGKGDFQFRAYAVDTGHEHRLFHSFEIRSEEPAKAADFAEHLRPVGGTDNRLDSALERVAKIDVHPGLRIGLSPGWFS